MSHVKDTNALYNGQWLINTEVRQGFGSLRRKNGEHYVGFFQGNAFHGRGILNYTKESLEDNKIQYIGDFQMGEPEGIGTIYWENGDKCKTTWFLGEMKDDSEGVYTWANGISTSSITCLKPDNVMFDPTPKLIFHKDDYRKEYVGCVKNGYVMHG